jgi:hypothetical protein
MKPWSLSGDNLILEKYAEFESKSAIILLPSRTEQMFANTGRYPKIQLWGT